MKVILVSRDGDLYKLCREILSEIPGCDLHLSTATPANCTPGAALYIWDDQTDVDLPQELEPSLSKHVFLIHRKDVAKFHHNLGGAEANILLKPVTRATLAAFLGLAASQPQDRSSTAYSLRTDRDEMLQCLIQANLKLQEYDQDRTNFLTRAVHDFRAPLTAVSGYCGLLLSDALGTLTEDQKEVLQRMQHSTRRLSRMASAMFQLSIGRHVRNWPDFRLGDIQECMDQALHEITPFADNKLISLSVNLDTAPDSLYFEPGQIEQVLINLLDNACKFTPKAGEIDIQGYPFLWDRRSMRDFTPPAVERRYQDSREPNSYRIDIRNSGCRIPGEHLDSIFEEYTSYAGGQDRSGGGLGLALCRMIATQHEGRVWAENTDIGPMFSFVLPVHSKQPAVSGAGQARLLDYTEAW
jgi:signal transduction histidine kinase